MAEQMTVSAAAPQVATPQTRGRAGMSLTRLAWQRFRRHQMALVGGVVLLVIMAISAAAPFLAAEDAANKVNPLNIRLSPSPAHPFADAVLSIPSLFLLIILTRVFGPTVPAIILVIGLLNWMQVSRIVRANFLSLKERDFVLAARSIGVNDGAIILRHVLPNTLAPVIVAATLGIGHAIILEASASFLGLGVQPPTASWGSTLYRAQEVMVMAPWVAIFPGLMILVTVLCINFLGDGLRDALDPHVRGR